MTFGKKSKQLLSYQLVSAGFRWLQVVLCFSKYDYATKTIEFHWTKSWAFDFFHWNILWKPWKTVFLEFNVKPLGQEFESCQLIASDKSNLLRKVLFLLKSGFQVMAFFFLSEVGYIVTIVFHLVFV